MIGLFPVDVATDLSNSLMQMNKQGEINTFCEKYHFRPTSTTTFKPHLTEETDYNRNNIMCLSISSPYRLIITSSHGSHQYWDWHQANTSTNSV